MSDLNTLSVDQLRVRARELGMSGAVLYQVSKEVLRNACIYASDHGAAGAQSMVERAAKQRVIEREGRFTDGGGDAKNPPGAGAQGDHQDEEREGSGEGESEESEDQGEGEGQSDSNGDESLADRIARETAAPIMSAIGPQIVAASMVKAGECVGGLFADHIRDVTPDIMKVAEKTGRQIARDEWRKAAALAVEEAQGKTIILREQVTVMRENAEPITVEGAHHLLARALDLISLQPLQSLLLVGPMGSGKTTLAQHIALALGLPHYILPMSGGVTESAIYGRKDPLSDKYIWPAALRLMQNGGVLVIDEYDAADANALTALNAALANRVIEPPLLGERIELHKDLYTVFAGNTWGRGFSADYAGRSQQDGATLNRFPMSRLEIGYDERLEARLCVDSKLRGALTRMRKAAIDTGVASWGISTRHMVQGAELLRRGWSVRDICEQAALGLTAEESSRVLADVR